MTGKIFELSANLIQTFVMTWFLSDFFGCKYSDKIKKIGFVLTWLTVFVEISFINHIVLYDGILSGISILTFFAYCRLCLKGKSSTHIFVCFFTMALVFSISSITIFTVTMLAHISTAELMSTFSGWRILNVTISKILEVLVFGIIVNIKNDYALTKKEWILFITMPLMTWLAIMVMTDASLKANEITSYMFSASIIIIVINIIIYYFMIKIGQDAKKLNEFKFVKMQYNNVKKIEVNMKALSENVYSVKHDIEKYLITIRTMAENNQNDNIVTFVNSIIKENLNGVQKIVFTDNDIFNAIVNTKLEICKQKGILASVNVSNEAVNNIKPEDITIIFGNILDNAMEAAEHSVKKILILIVQLQQEYVSIYLENSYDENYSDPDLNTSKENSIEHGFGIKNVRKVVEESSGMMEMFTDENNMFCCDILVKKCK